MLVLLGSGLVAYMIKFLVPVIPQSMQGKLVWQVSLVMILAGIILVVTSWFFYS